MTEMPTNETCENCPNLISKKEYDFRLYNEHIFSISHELRTPLAVMSSTCLNQLSYLRSLYHSIEHNDNNLFLIKQLKESIYNIEDQIENIDKFITKLSDHGLYNTNNNDKLLMPIKNYLNHILDIMPSFSRSMAAFGDSGISFGEMSGLDFENVHVVVNPQELNQIIMNISVNAADAVSSWYKKKRNYYPKLKVRCLKTFSPNKLIRLKNMIHGPIGYDNKEFAFFIVIEDNGPGIEQKHLSSIFDLGVTSKCVEDKKDVHFGMGLHICANLARKNKLSIFVETTSGLGTRFFIGFPKMFVSKGCDFQDRINLKDIIQTDDDYKLLSHSRDSYDLYKEFVVHDGENEISSSTFVKKRVDEDTGTVNVYKPRKPKI